MARTIAARALPVYAALTYDGRIDLSPADPLDATIASAVNAHQHTDKGFGPALGPSAAAAAIHFLGSLPAAFPSDVRRPESPLAALAGFFRDAKRIGRDHAAGPALFALVVHWLPTFGGLARN